MKAMTGAVLLSLSVLVGCGSSDSGGQVTLASPTTAVPITTISIPAIVDPSAPMTVTDIAQRFIGQVNQRDMATVAEAAPDASASTLDFLVGGGPYETVDCYVFDGRDECRVVNGIADFTFVVDVASGQVTDITYVGGE